MAETWRIGFFAGYSHSDFDVDERASSGMSDDYHLGLYGGRQLGPWSLRAGAGYSWHDIQTERSVAFAGFADSLAADYSAATAQAFGEVGYRIDHGHSVFEPFAGLAYVNLDANSFTERGGSAALTNFGQASDLTFSTLGVHAETPVGLGTIAATARGMIGWRHSFGDVTPAVSSAFLGGDAFSVEGTPVARDELLIEAGVDFAMSDATHLALSYGSEFAADAQSQVAHADISVRF